jgi:hypothetical protein
MSSERRKSAATSANNNSAKKFIASNGEEQEKLEEDEEERRKGVHTLERLSFTEDTPHCEEEGKGDVLNVRKEDEAAEEESGKDDSIIESAAPLRPLARKEPARAPICNRRLIVDIGRPDLTRWS